MPHRQSGRSSSLPIFCLKYVQMDLLQSRKMSKFNYTHMKQVCLQKNDAGIGKMNSKLLYYYIYTFTLFNAIINDIRIRQISQVINNLHIVSVIISTVRLLKYINHLARGIAQTGSVRHL